MEWGPKLERQRSYACPGLGICNWCNSSRRSTGFSRRFNESDYDDYEFDPSEYSTGRSIRMTWRGLWRRIMKEKRKIFYSAAPIHVPYDPYSYEQNFDQGEAWLEPEDLSRSFSARFADPSRILQRISRSDN